MAAVAFWTSCRPEQSGAGAFPADAFDHPAAGALMVYDPSDGDAPGWRPQCGLALVHPRVALTAGHCIQFLRAGMASGALEAAWVSFQDDPTAHFDADPALEDPTSGGWHAIASVHVSPETIDFVELRRSGTASTLSVWGSFHDSGAIVLDQAVTDITPLRTARGAREVERLLQRARCGSEGDACRLVEIAYGLREAPPAMVPPVLVRHTARLRFRAIDSLFVSTFDEPPGSGYGRSCPGDSGSPVVLVGRDAASSVVVAIVSSPADPFSVPCTGGSLQYRVDTEAHRRFIDGVIRSVDGR